MNNIEILLNQIKVELPAVEIDKINLDNILNMHANGELVDLFQRDVLLFSFFSILGKKVKLHLTRQKNKLEDLESDIFVRLTDELGSKTSATEIKRRTQQDVTYRTLRNLITEIEGKHDLIESLVDGLTKKSIALSVITARDRAEIQSGLK